MIQVQKAEKTPVVVVRAASGYELSEYEKKKLAGVEENAQANKIEFIRVNDQRVQVDPLTKEAKINLGNLAFKSTISPKDLSTDELFFIKCELDETDL